MKAFRIRPLTWALATAVVIAGVVGLVVSPAMAQTHASAHAAAPVKTTTGHILVTPKGMTLYVFAADPKGKSTCSGQCAKFWPPQKVAAGVTPRAKIKGTPGTFGVISRDDGTRQLTYDGAPVYTFLEDKKPGDMNGQGVVAAGGYWWVVVAAGH
jgi:predicted lipoprotein with Yx(FWY)xxD motif